MQSRARGAPSLPHHDRGPRVTQIPATPNTKPASTPPVKTIQKSAKLNNVCYDIRGPVLEKAKQMEEEGHQIIKLNIATWPRSASMPRKRSSRT